MYLSGMIVMGYNTWMTMRGTESVDARIPSLNPHKPAPASADGGIPEHA
jgi:cytochrome c oxidase cbb3-type subunit 1